MNNLGLIRRSKDITQYQLSINTNIPQSVISLIERNFKDPSMEAKKLISEILDCSVEDIFPEMK